MLAPALDAKEVFLMFKRIVPVLMAGYALWRWQRARGLEHQRHSSAAKPAEMNTWEGEGGALRGTGSQTGPSPARR